jgi:uncharacterized protein (TIGR02271 family)
MTTDATRAYDWRGREIIDCDGKKVGTIEELYYDTETRRPEWAAIRTGMLGTKLNFVPISQVQPHGDELRVSFDKAQIKDAPSIDPDRELSQSEEERLYSHYGMSYGDRRLDSGLREGRRGTSGREPVGRDTSGPTTDNAMTRSEEEVRVGTAREQAGRARLRKWVETEEVQKTVPVRREKARIEREPITDDNLDRATSGPDISDEEHEVVLHQEEPVVEKRTVPKERVRLEKDVETDDETVSEEVRKERIESEGDINR